MPTARRVGSRSGTIVKRGAGGKVMGSLKTNAQAAKSAKAGLASVYARLGKSPSQIQAALDNIDAAHKKWDARTKRADAMAKAKKRMDDIKAKKAAQPYHKQGSTR